MVKIKDIISHLEHIAPGTYQESYDNAGLLTGNPTEEVNGVLISLDVTEEIVDDAIEQNCNLIIAHHPIIFKGLKKLTGNNYVERTVIKAIKHDIAIFAIHTNLDNVHTGVNKKICDLLGLHNTKILSPKTHNLLKLTVFIPKENTRDVLDALFDAGAGNIGDYSHCSYIINGKGTFLPGEGANPHIGTRNQLEEVDEDRVEMIFPAHLKSNIMKALLDAHPYEEVAHFLHNLANTNNEVGSGMVGELKEPMSEEQFLQHLKAKMNLNVIRHTQLTGATVSKVAVCGGAGSFLLNKAVNSGAQFFVSSDFKYHEFFDADGNIVIADIGHYESEIFTKDLLHALLYKKFSNIALQITKVNSNPIRYTV